MADRGDFAALLRAWRERLQPAAVGFPTGNRRTSGLRREEVALLAGVSVDYLVRLEQGRADRPSAGQAAWPGSSLYNATKWGIEGFCKALAAAGRLRRLAGRRGAGLPGRRPARGGR